MVYPRVFHVCTLLIGLTLVTGCASSIAQMQTGKVLKKGAIEAGAGLSAPIAPSTFERLKVLGQAAYDAATSADVQGTTLSDDDVRDLVEAGLGIILFNPSVVTEFWGRYGLLDRVDVGVRWGGARLLLDARVQLLRDESAGVDAALTLGYAHHSDLGPSIVKPLFDVFEKLSILNFSREDVIVDLAFSRQRGVFGWYGAVGYTLAMTDFGASTPSELQTVTDLGQANFANSMHVIRGVAGVSLKYKFLWLRAELAVARVLLEPTILDVELDLSAWQVSPGLAVGVQW